MKKFREWVPLLGVLALAALFLKLPEIAKLFKCKSCQTSNPFITLMAAGYFAILVSAALLFPRFPSTLMARAGLFWSILLTAVFTYLNLPSLCFECLFAHACHVLMWSAWVLLPSNETKPLRNVKERCFLLLFFPVSVISMFCGLNMTFMAYSFKINEPVLSLHEGESAPDLLDQDSQGQVVFNFIAPDCPYCIEQLPIINQIASQTPSYRFITISSEISPEFVQKFSALEWVEDRDGKIKKQFKVSGFPTTYVVNNDRKIGKVILGLPEQLNSILSASLESN